MCPPDRLTTIRTIYSVNIIKHRRAAVCDNEAANYLEVTISNYYLHIHVNKAEKHTCQMKECVKMDD